MGAVSPPITAPLSDRVAEALFGKTKRGLLALLFGQPNKSFYLRQILRETGLGSGAVQRELAQLAGADLIRRTEEGSQVHFQANADSPVYSELCSLLTKTAGMADSLRAVLLPFAHQRKILVAFIYGSVAKGRQRAISDVDLMIVGKIGLSGLLPALRPLQDRLGREINPSIYQPAEFAQKLSRDDHFLRSVMSQPKLLIIGTEDDLGKLAGERLVERT